MMQSEVMKGKVVLITGATSGIGKVSAITLAGMGATVVVIGRNLEKGKELLKEIERRTDSKETDFIMGDLASLDDVRSAAMNFNSRYDRLDALLDNAGGINGKRMVTEEGFEYTFGVNHIAHFVLTQLVLDRLKSSAPSRVVVTSSAAHLNGHIDFDDLMAEKKYRSFKAYSQSKLANVLFTFELSRRLKGIGVTANCFHPGTVRTNFGKGLGGIGGAIFPLIGVFMIPPEKGSETQVYLASSPDVEGVTGKYFSKKAVKDSSRKSRDEEVAKRLWDVSEELTKKWLL
jgi:NAD(P)-dependent dehydrogenase (short-subunit alcohol dehydrogenase family)